ncbi:MAG: hypothetical protein LBT00_08905 [Spirochaetaceae bacterium]|jgi:uncharacterized membrane protein|nr:hypothetical protein [Spirochaetaceae bacterium]
MARESASIEERVLIRQYNGPIPPPSDLKELQVISPDFPERVMRIAEAHAKVDVQTKNRDSIASLVTPITAQIITFLLGIAGIAGCIYLSNAGHEAGGIAAIVGSFSPMVIAALSNLKKK